MTLTAIEIADKELNKKFSAVRPTTLFQKGVGEYKLSTNDKGNTLVSGLNVFRSGTFRDSMGEQHTWEAEHMTGMVANFNLLSDKGVFPNVPVRDGHKGIFGTGGTVVGYMTGLDTKKGTVNGEDATFLVGDFEFTDPAAAEKLKNGTFRARSAEIGMYVTNDEAPYFPVFMGFAWVDIPAVEHLFGRYSQADGPDPVVVFEENKEMTGAPALPTVQKFNIGGQEFTDANAVQAHIIRLEGLAAKAETKFSINGVETTDFAAVQSHVTVLEGIIDATKKLGREDFVKGLAKDSKIQMSQVDDVKAKVLEMDDSAYSLFQTVMGTVVSSPVGQRMPGGVTNLDGNNEHGVSQLDQDILDGEAILHGLKTGGAMTEEQIIKTDAYKRLQGLYAQKTANKA